MKVASSNWYTRGTPVGTLRPTMASSEMPSMCLMSALRELPCATTIRRLPCLTRGCSVLSQKGTTRSLQVLVLSVAGSLEMSRPA